MFDFKLVLWILRVFYLFGQNSVILQTYTSSAYKNRKKQQFLISFPPYLYLFMFLISLPIVIVYQQEYKIFFTYSSAIVNFTFLLATSLCLVYVSVQTMYLPNHLTKLVAKFKLLIVYLEKRLQLKLDSRDFLHTYLSKCGLIFFCWLLMFVVKLLTKTVPIQFLLCWSFTLLMKSVTNMHVLFFVDYLQFIYGALNVYYDNVLHEAIVTRTINWKGFTLVSVLRHYKYVHYQLWKCCRIINVYFGWIVLFLLLANFIEISYSVYWIFLYIAKDNMNRVLRKFTTYIYL